MAVVLILAGHGASQVAERRDQKIERIGESTELLERLAGTAAQRDWLDRAPAAEKARRAILATLPVARTEGAAQADLQAWLTQLAKDATLSDPRVAIEATVEVPGYPELVQVMGRIDGTVPRRLDLPPFLRALSAGLPWRQAQLVQLSDAEPVRVSAIVKAFYARRPLLQGQVPREPAGRASGASAAGSGSATADAPGAEPAEGAAK